MKFALGRVVATPGALELVGHEGCLILLRRHQGGDWGDLDAHDRRANESALKTEARLLSAYTVGGERLWLITEADRSATTVLLSSEY